MGVVLGGGGNRGSDTGNGDMKFWDYLLPMVVTVPGPLLPDAFSLRPLLSRNQPVPAVYMVSSYQVLDNRARGPRQGEGAGRLCT